VNPESLSVVRMTGELDLLRRDEIGAMLRVTGPRPPMLVDLSEVTYADSSVLAELLRFHGEAKRHGVRVALVIASRQFARLVQYAGLGQAFHIFNSIDAARDFCEHGTGS